MTITKILLVLLGLAAWDLLKHLYRGVKLWRLHRRAQRWDRFQAWRRQQQATWRATYPTSRTRRENPPYLGLDLDVPVFTERRRHNA